MEHICCKNEYLLCCIKTLEVHQNKNTTQNVSFTKIHINVIRNLHPTFLRFFRYEHYQSNLKYVEYLGKSLSSTRLLGKTEELV